MGIGGIEGDINSSRILVLVENFVPCFAAIAGAEDSAFRVSAKRMAQSGHEYDIRIFGVYDDLANGPGITQPHVLPGFSAIDGFINAVTWEMFPRMQASPVPT